MTFWRDKSSDSTNTVIFVISLAVIIVIILVVNVLKNKSPTTFSGGGKAKSSASTVPTAGFRPFAGFTMHRLARNIGLDSEQTKTLDFVLKYDGVTDVEKSINSPTLLDRHFKRAYHNIENTANTDEEAQGRLAILFSTRNILENNSSGGSITSTHQLPDNISAIITINNKDKYPVKVVSTKGDTLNVECPENALGSLVKIPKGSKLGVLVFTKSNKGFSFESRVLGTSSSQGTPLLQLAHTSQLKRLAQRRFRRRQASIACYFYFVYVDQAGKKSDNRLVVDKRRLSGTIMDVSAGGCSIKSVSPVTVGARLKIEYTQKDFTVAALGQVLRTNRSGASIIMHIKFLKVPRKSMNTINAYVYEYANE